MILNQINKNEIESLLSILQILVFREFARAWPSVNFNGIFRSILNPY